MSGIIARVEARQAWSWMKMRTMYWSAQIARNGEVVYTSETYTTAQKRDQTAKQAAAQLDVPYREMGESGIPHPDELE